MNAEMRMATATVMQSVLLQVSLQVGCSLVVGSMVVGCSLVVGWLWVVDSLVFHTH